MEQFIIGVLGGMGPAATVDFMQKVIDFTDAKNDQAHIPMLVSCVPDVPDRSAAILDNGTSPLPVLMKYCERLQNAGASLIVMPCNTAHFWFDDLALFAKVPMLSIIDAVVEEIKERGLKKVGLFATNATIAAKLYQNKLTEFNIPYVALTPERQSEVMASIYALKSGDLETAVTKLEAQKEFLAQNGAEAIILGCTETPVIMKDAMANSPELFVDSNAALARAVIHWVEMQTGQKLQRR